MNRKAIDVDPYDCEECGARGRVLEARKCPGYVRRRHQCECGLRWTSYHSRLNPRSALRKLARLARRARPFDAAPVETPRIVADPSKTAPAAPPDISPRPPAPSAHPPAQRRVARSSYLDR